MIVLASIQTQTYDEHLINIFSLIAKLEQYLIHTKLKVSIFNCRIPFKVSNNIFYKNYSVQM